MNMKSKWSCLTIAGLVGLGACGMEITQPEQDGRIFTPTDTFPSYAGLYRGRASALSQGLGTTCDVDVSIVQDEKSLKIDRLEYDCADGTTWGFDQPMNFELRAPANQIHLAYDIYYNGKDVGFLNYSNSAAHIGLTQLGSSIVMVLSQDKEGRTLEAFRLVYNDQMLFDAKPAKLTLK